MISDDRYNELLRQAIGLELAAISQLPLADRWAAVERIWELQGESPADRAWPTERGNDPEPEEGWDPSGTYRPDVVRRIYEELVQAGKIRPREK